MDECIESAKTLKTRNERVRECAYFIWLQTRREDAMRNWLEAEQKERENASAYELE